MVEVIVHRRNLHFELYESDNGVIAVHFDGNVEDILEELSDGRH